MRGDSGLNYKENQEKERDLEYIFEEQLMALADELDVGSEVMTRIKFGYLSFDLRKRIHDGIIHSYEEAEEQYSVGWGFAVEINHSVL